jgi:hypothetical protein
MQVLAAPDVQRFVDDYFQHWVQPQSAKLGESQVPRSVLRFSLYGAVKQAVEHYMVGGLERFHEDAIMETLIHVIGTKKSQGALGRVDFSRTPKGTANILSYVYTAIKNFASTLGDRYERQEGRNSIPETPLLNRDFSLEHLQETLSDEQEYEDFRDYALKRYPKQIDIFRGGVKVERNHPFTIGDILDLIYDGHSPGEIKDKYEFDGSRLNIFFDKLKQFGHEYFQRGLR